jgi:hypothetical protein
VGEKRQLFVARQAAPLLRRAAPEHAHRAVLLRRAHRLAAPVARVQVFGGLRCAVHEQHGHHGKLLRRAALQQQHVVVVGQREQRAHVALELGDDRGKPVRAVADAQDRQTHLGHFEYGLLHLL